MRGNMSPYGPVEAWSGPDGRRIADSELIRAVAAQSRDHLRYDH